jgi:hypothetical protein
MQQMVHNDERGFRRCHRRHLQRGASRREDVEAEQLLYVALEDEPAMLANSCFLASRLAVAPRPMHVTQVQALSILLALHLWTAARAAFVGAPRAMPPPCSLSGLS